jgi:TRAP-type C4-dicarboxylate transport system substrate-binding protein
MTPVLMPKRTWEKLPKKVQNEMMALAREMPEKTDEMISEKELNVMEEMKQEGILIYEISDEDKARIKAVARNVAKTLVDDLKNKGVKKADEGMTFYLNTIEKYSRR